ncbi:MAG: hypothetical protein ABSB59_06520 [Streptosporangiaceae bacterium]
MLVRPQQYVIGRVPVDQVGTAALFVAGVMLAAFSPSYGVLVAARSRYTQNSIRKSSGDSAR